MSKFHSKILKTKKTKVATASLLLTGDCHANPPDKEGGGVKNGPKKDDVICERSLVSLSHYIFLRFIRISLRISEIHRYAPTVINPDVDSGIYFDNFDHII